MEAWESAAAKFLAYYEVVKALHAGVTGKPLAEYQPTDRARLVDAMQESLASGLQGREFVAEVLHLLVWRQCLGNGNHRTTFLFVQNFLSHLGVRFPHYSADPNAEMRLRSDISRYTERSKDYLERQNEFGYGPKEFENRHRGMARQMLDELIGPQSFDWTTVGPQRLSDFISRSEMSG